MESLIKFDDLVGTKFQIKIGSGYHYNIDSWNKERLHELIVKSLKHYLFDWDFHYNYTNNSEEYVELMKNIIDSIMENTDHTLNIFFKFDNVRGSKTFIFNTDKINPQSWIDNWFKNNNQISETLREDYFNYRKERAEVDLK